MAHCHNFVMVVSHFGVFEEVLQVFSRGTAVHDRHNANGSEETVAMRLDTPVTTDGATLVLPVISPRPDATISWVAGGRPQPIGSDAATQERLRPVIVADTRAVMGSILSIQDNQAMVLAFLALVATLGGSGLTVAFEDSWARLCGFLASIGLFVSLLMAARIFGARRERDVSPSPTESGYETHIQACQQRQPKAATAFEELVSKGREAHIQLADFRQQIGRAWWLFFTGLPLLLLATWLEAWLG